MQLFQQIRSRIERSRILQLIVLVVMIMVLSGLGLFFLIMLVFFMIPSSFYNENYNGSPEEGVFIGDSIYKNTNHGFQFTYPKGSTFSKDLQDISEGSIAEFILNNPQTPRNDQENAGVQLYTITDNLSLEDIARVKKESKEKRRPSGSVNVQEIQFGGQKGYKVSDVSPWYDHIYSDQEKQNTYIEYFTIKNGRMYQLYAFLFTTPNLDEKLIAVDDMAQSFKFIE